MFWVVVLAPSKLQVLSFFEVARLAPSKLEMPGSDGPDAVPLNALYKTIRSSQIMPTLKKAGWGVRVCLGLLSQH